MKYVRHRSSYSFHVFSFVLRYFAFEKKKNSASTSMELKQFSFDVIFSGDYSTFFTFWLSNTESSTEWKKAKYSELNKNGTNHNRNRNTSFELPHIHTHTREKTANGKTTGNLLLKLVRAHLKSVACVSVSVRNTGGSHHDWFFGLNAANSRIFILKAYYTSEINFMHSSLNVCVYF